MFSSMVNWSVKLLGKEPKMLRFGGDEQEKTSAERSRRIMAFNKMNK